MTKQVPVIPLSTYFDLETPICDLDQTLDVLAALCGEKLSRTGNVVLSEREATRIYFMLCMTQRASRDLKAAYFGKGWA